MHLDREFPVRDSPVQDSPVQGWSVQGWSVLVAWAAPDHTQLSQEQQHKQP